jgi:hypothetical protein
LTSSTASGAPASGDQLVELVVELRKADVMTAPLDHQFGTGICKQQSLGAVGLGGR